ncbi:uncharacterized protein BCR38DRAFT_436676 [Pseudomassariella vexata]|uniref:Riboflavin kinase n=1 Tax=Pseudomassariella vexata TaxID=1141098 RepID=A0A1Y2DXL3_9PEZI|nr:uncharacterized protein BCR38DRAFT_436676 [Pseudomassariella vexata]ORY63365.1 hypothetical protein BCR38DRAFT_436676 [Pseudomassariella vexata]
MDTSKVEKVRRKPLPSAPPSPSPEYSDIFDDYFDDQVQDELLAEQAKNGSLVTRPSMPPRPNTVPLDAGSSAPSVAPAPTTTTMTGDGPKSMWKTALDETIHFAGGLISHPFESTKHFSILRHSSGLVFYRGPTTSITITIFADAPLPADRSLWLQRKGYSGNMGMNASALLGTTTNWIDVTPSSEGLVRDIPESDERAWQRDLKKFSKKTAKHKTMSKHAARETCIIRIPAAAEDGYLRIVMCTGDRRKKVLCPSPVFRVASTSSDVSILRGASLATLPLETGLKAASVIGTAMANKYIGPARAVVQGGLGKCTEKFTPGIVTKHVAKNADHIAYAKSGLQDKFEALEQHFDSARDVSYDPLPVQAAFDSPPEVVGHDSGPELPFPIRLDGKVVESTGQGQLQTGIPTANLCGVDDDLLARLKGIYMGWASVEPRKGLEDIPHDWHEAIIIIAPSPHAARRVVSKNVAAVHIIHDFGPAKFFDAKLKVVAMACLCRVPEVNPTRPLDDLAEAVRRNVNITLASLSREHWEPEMTIYRLKTEKSSHSLADKYVEARTQLQKRVDSVPLHLAGVRTAGMEKMDKIHGNGGLWIRR